MKKVLITLVVILLVLAVAAYLAYPTVIRQAAGVRDDGIMQEYRRKAGRMTTEEIQERLDKAAAYNETLQEVLPEDPFSGREVLTLHRYEAPLNTGDGLIGILTIPGISYRMGAMILAEICDFSRFDSPDKLLAYAGLSPSTYQSGKLDNAYPHMEKRGSRYLRYALFNAAKHVCIWDNTFAAYLAKKRAEGKHYNVAISHAAKKLVRLIFALQKSGKAYLAPA